MGRKVRKPDALHLTKVCFIFQLKPRSGVIMVQREPRHYCPGSMKTPKTLLTNLMKTHFLRLWTFGYGTLDLLLSLKSKHPTSKV